jgi:hypothetical protein
MFKLCTKYDIFCSHCGPQGPSYCILLPVETFFTIMWPSIDLSLRPLIWTINFWSILYLYFFIFAEVDHEAGHEAANAIANDDQTEAIDDSNLNDERQSGEPIQEPQRTAHSNIDKRYVFLFLSIIYCQICDLSILKSLKFDVNFSSNGMFSMTYRIHLQHNFDPLSDCYTSPNPWPYLEASGIS